MSKVIRRQKKEPAISYPVTQLYYDIDTIRMTMKPMNDLELFDYASHHIEMYKKYDLDCLYEKLSQDEKLTEEERESLEAFCILANTDMGYNA